MRSALPPRVRLMGMPIDPVTEVQAVEHMFASLGRGQGGWVITPNLDQLRLYHHDPSLRPMYEEASLVLADGMPLLWACQLQRTPLPQRVAGSELIFTLSSAAAGHERSIFLLGGNPGAADGAARKLSERYAGLRIAGTYCPPFGFERNDAEMARIESLLSESRADFVFVGLGFPKQERLIARIRHVLPQAWFLGIGVSLSFASGDIRQAPIWMRRTGLEWIHRMFQEPGRLFDRYVLKDLPFAFRVLANVTGFNGNGCV